MREAAMSVADELLSPVERPRPYERFLNLWRSRELEPASLVE
jgi:hypothetical protein